MHSTREIMKKKWKRKLQEREEWEENGKNIEREENVFESSFLQSVHIKSISYRQSWIS